MYGNLDATYNFLTILKLLSTKKVTSSKLLGLLLDSNSSGYSLTDQFFKMHIPHFYHYIMIGTINRF